ncbi:head-tail connector protein [Peptostreptococcus sp. D1]|uniref:head-tail connector protein n=1 Tax=Peptostreptococcus sp. D1 TaxID=72304 RepID=UPI0008DF4850|nr:head-tail connector protein [Peptostreptococcus sp. D1]SFE84117.1 hypothetical protein SAMN02910278_01844 [Peptostreptococcus sp. D1]
MIDITIDEACNYIGIDYMDSTIEDNLHRAIKTADAILKGSIGEKYPVDDPRAKELGLIIINDLYENRNAESNTIKGTTRRLVDDMSLQLRMELRRRKRE